jgi:Domain of unknown function (DUF4118)
MLAAVVVPIAVSVALIPWRDQLDPSDNALFLVVVVVAIASTGRRLAGFVAAVVSGLAFDYFLTHPYGSFRITRHSDFITEILLLVVGLAVAQIAARGQHHRAAASEGRRQMAMLHSVTELAASGKDPETVIDAAVHELSDLLTLRECRFTERHPAPDSPRVTLDGQVNVGDRTWATEELGLPRSVDLPVRSGGWLLGHFLLTPTPGKPVSPDRLLVAVAIADQVGASLATEDTQDGSTDIPDDPES